MTSAILPSQPTPPATPQLHPVVTTLLTIFTLLPLGLVLAMIVTGLIWTPWQVHAFQATNDEELSAHYAAIVFSILLGIPLAVLGLICGHVALWLAGTDKSRRTALANMGKRVGTVGAARMTLIVILFASLVFGYLSILLQGFYLVWRLIHPEYL